MRAAVGGQGEERQAVSACSEQVCTTCADAVVLVRVIEILGGGMARVETGISIEEVCIDLVEAAVGDTLLVHAGVAIGHV
jgi:hypothetical protein